MKKVLSLTLALLMVLALAGCGGGSGSGGGASGYPKKDVQIIIPYAPGGGSDNLVRGTMQHLDLGATTVAINVEGASGYIGALQGFNSSNGVHLRRGDGLQPPVHQPRHRMDHRPGGH